MIFLSPTVQNGLEDESQITDFQEQKKLGQGAFGLVSQVVHKQSNLMYAIKKLSKTQLKQQNMAENVRQEIKIMYELNHLNIVKIINHFEEEYYIYLVIEFANGGQLYNNMMKSPNKKFDEKTVAKYISQLIDVLIYIHSKNIIHRDIKPENILLDAKGNIKLADFGWSSFIKPDQVRETYCGTLDYLSPEMADKAHAHNESVDIWAVGVLTYELIAGYLIQQQGKAPFSPTEKQMTKQNILTYNYKLPDEIFSPLVKQFIKKILVKQSSRASLQQLKEENWIKFNTQDMQVQSPIKQDIQINQEIDPKQKLKMEKYNITSEFTNDQLSKIISKQSIINKKYEESFSSQPNFFKGNTEKPADVQIQPQNKFAQIIQEQQKEIENLKMQLKGNNQSIDSQQLILENNNLKFQLKTKDENIQSLETQKAQLLKELQINLEKLKQVQNNQPQQVSSSKADTGGISQTLKKKIMDLQDENLDLLNNLQTAQDDLETAQSQVKKLQYQNKMLQDQINKK